MSKTIYLLFKQYYHYNQEFEVYTLEPNVGNLLKSYSCEYDAETELTRLQRKFFSEFWKSEHSAFPTRHFAQYNSSFIQKAIFDNTKSKETIDFCQTVWGNKPHFVSTKIVSISEMILSPPSGEKEFAIFEQEKKKYFELSDDKFQLVLDHQHLFNLPGYFIQRSLMDDFGEDFGDGGY